jgi:hypothetical protein
MFLASGGSRAGIPNGVPGAALGSGGKFSLQSLAPSPRRPKGPNHGKVMVHVTSYLPFRSNSGLSSSLLLSWSGAVVRFVAVVRIPFSFVD